MSQSTANVRDDWWHVIAFLPLAMVISGILGGLIGAMLYLPILLLYPIALRKDAHWINGTSSEWQPNPNQFTILGLLTLLTVGLLSVIISPLYLYWRQKHVSW